ncbi:YggS family pyridoxal phosphate-dependent enzyme [Thermus brockianus]|uniref:Pyridoxal phosphate homeostasis protein n=1 Tax=Thermus brockianus TaxID=56956 RepID=A0ABM7XI31_THEBO|nr:YggS family pyridoxal phosphate-dependent enzyme [Thermus brockianus]BDG15946.1 YggS family pyridoxal phosphate enzyme [Thermus brockianus]
MGLPEVLERIAAACQRAGRDPGEVRLVAVTKGRTPEEIREKVLRYGDFPLGESRVQEALKKMEVLRAEWHLIGHLQRNKAKFAPRFALIHSLDSFRLAEALEGVGAKAGKRLRVLVEVNLGREPQKHGVLEEELPELLARVRELEHLEVLGLMTVPPIGPEGVVRPLFRKLSQLADHFGLPERSMGMSDDYVWAVEEGATLVRIGRALFVD